MFFETKSVEFLGQKFVDRLGEFEVKDVTVPRDIKSYWDKSISILQKLAGPTSQ